MKKIPALTLDTEALKEAFQQAQQEMKTERQQSMMDKLVENGVITQEQADEYQAWLDARPDVNISPDLNRQQGMPFGRMNHDFGKMQGRLGQCFQDTEPATVQ